MKKMFLYLIVTTAMLMCPSCEKTTDTQGKGYHSDNKVILLPTETKESSYLLTITTGHLRAHCGGSCISINGKPCHIDCMGDGHICLTSAAVSLNQVGADLTATTTDTFGLTSEDFFNMPDRSLNYTDENNNRIFLNIPAQLVCRDTATKQFTFTGLFFSETPEYTNN